jgi:hypothetical protein
MGGRSPAGLRGATTEISPTGFSSLESEQRARPDPEPPHGLAREPKGSHCGVRRCRVTGHSYLALLIRDQT